ncbi:MAG: shikimate dehydrogenase [Candidatus Marinimicrobia bacterium]|nr:shikimate dehydrogenase [Candidatus Neomarinimicrobiota bacterium]
MKQFAVIGYPIAHSLSPVLHREIYRQLDLEASFEKIHVMQNELHSFMKENELDGFNVTIPHKQSVIPFLDELDESAQIIGAVNCVHNGIGYNTDWIGFTKAMEQNGVDLKEKNSLILGAGGAARAVAYALIQSNVNSISIMNRTKQNADTLVKWIKNNSNISVNTQTHEHSNTQTLIINCTPLGMWPNTEAIPEFEIQKDQVLVDTIYNPIETRWLELGKEKGAKVIGGLDMFITQGLASADIWFGEKISKKIKFDPLKKVLKLKLC